MPPGSTRTKRINREVADLAKEELGGMTLAPTDANIFLWKGSIPGPEGSPYEGGVFHLNIELMKDYPFSAPKVTFVTRIYHMNISDRGGVCIDILKHNWSPALSLYKVLLSLSSLLTDPNPSDPLVPPIAMEYSKNRKKHDQIAKEWTRMYALPPSATPGITMADGQAHARGKGKVKATDLIVSNVGESSSSRARARRGGPCAPNAPRVVDEVISLDSDPETEATTRSGTKRKRNEGAAVNPTVRRRMTDDNNNVNQRQPTQHGDVIVIED